MNIKILTKEMICPISKKKTFSFKDYYIEKYILDNNLNESPQDIGRRYPDVMDNLGYNKEDTLNTISNGKYIETIKLFDDIIIDIYCLHNTEYYFIDKKNLTTIAYVFISKENDHFKITGMWKHKAYKSIMSTIFTKYIIPKFKFITTDISMSSQGINFWRNFSKAHYNNYELVQSQNGILEKIVSWVIPKKKEPNIKTSSVDIRVKK